VEPGQYSVTLSKSVDGKITQLSEPVTFNVKTIDNRTLPASNRAELTAFQSQVNELGRSVSASQQALGEVKNQLKHLREAIKNVQADQEDLTSSTNAIEDEVSSIERLLNGDDVASTLDIGTPPSVSSRIGWLLYAQASTTANPSRHHQDSYAIALEEYKPLLDRIRKLIVIDFAALEAKLAEAGAPFTPHAVPNLMENGN